MDPKIQTIVITAVLGIVAGWLASWVVGGGGLVQYLLSGVIGAFVGTYLLKFLGINLGLGNELLSTIVTSTIGAIVVVLLARLIV
jgi:uncharacterized membrane protein YeaQ/YmgE (transglycosylase-associated protein family)